MSKRYRALCKCGRCDVVMFDMVHRYKQRFYLEEVIENNRTIGYPHSMDLLEYDGEEYWACHFCGNDDRFEPFTEDI